jgi:hypothetical protein
VVERTRYPAAVYADRRGLVKMEGALALIGRVEAAHSAEEVQHRLLARVAFGCSATTIKDAVRKLAVTGTLLSQGSTSAVDKLGPKMVVPKLAAAKPYPEQLKDGDLTQITNGRAFKPSYWVQRSPNRAHSELNRAMSYQLVRQVSYFVRASIWRKGPAA